MKIMVKYCGGCNVYYDRPKVVEDIRARFPHFEITYDEAPGADYVVVLSGCPSQCVRHQHLNGRLGKSHIFGPEQIGPLMETLAGLEGR